MTREITAITTGILRRASRARFSYVQLADDIFVYERVLEVGWTENGTDFVTKPFFGHSGVMMTEDIGFMHPFFVSGMGRMAMPAEFVERGFVTAAGLQKLRDAGIGHAKLSDSDKHDIYHLRPVHADKARTDPSFSLRGYPERLPPIDFWKDIERPGAQLFRREKIAQRTVYNDPPAYFVSLDGVPLPTAVELALTQGNKPNEAQYGPYDWEKMGPHLKAKEGEVSVSQPPNRYYAGRVYWHPPSQDAYNTVWNKAQADDISLHDALIALDLLEIEQFRTEPEPEPVVEKKSRRKKVTS